MAKKKKNTAAMRRQAELEKRQQLGKNAAKKNREKQLPSAKGRTWYECDVNTTDGKRSDERIVYSSDGLIYYTPDAFKTFVQLY